MPHILKNKQLEIHIDLPEENYNFSRFDWTGKIVQVIYKNIPYFGIERNDSKNELQTGKGLYNEFGIDSPIGFNSAQKGDWFHKIGIGLLKKESDTYEFITKHPIRPAEFKTRAETDRLTTTCHSEQCRGYAYDLEKTIRLEENQIKINYQLHNTGEKAFSTDEYTHNFMAINKSVIDQDYILKLPFRLKPDLFDKTVNPERKIRIGQNLVNFSSALKKEFFFGNLSGNESVPAHWKIFHLKNRAGVSETGNFKTNKINLWGRSHVISPELFFQIDLKPGQTTNWCRTYHFFETDQS